jgi:predicted lipoprotein with Yx(FWY)xxD motif
MGEGGDAGLVTTASPSKEATMTTHTTRRSRAVRSGAALSAAAAGLLVLAACGSGGGSSTSTSSQPASSTGTTVTVHDAGGTSVLATSSGRTLYDSDQEQGKVLCTSGACTAIWSPLTVPAGQKPTAPSSVAPDLSTLKRPDGTMQVAFDGRPLYTFSIDTGAGQVNGNGKTDSFDGTDFTWHVAVPTGSGSGSMPSSGSSSGSGSSRGGYGY